MAINYGGNDWSSDPQMALRMQLAKGLMQGGQAPAQGVGENVANLGSKLIGAYLMKQGLDEGKARESARNDTMANALRAGQGQAAETKAYGDGTTINWDERKADPSQMAAILAGNRDTAPMGMQMQIGQMDEKRKNESAMATELLKNRLSRENEFYKPIKTDDGSIIIPALVPGFQMPGQAPRAQQAPNAPPALTPQAPDLRTASAAPNPPPVERQQLAAALGQSESGGQGPGVVNKQGYSGKYQFGEAAATAAGFYEPDDNPNDNKWNGTFKGLNGVSSYQEFLKNGAAQDQAFNMHQAHLGAEIKGRGLDKYIGQTIGGVPITHDGLTAMMHLGGPGGTEKFLKTGGQYNPADSGGTRLSDYGTKFANVGAQPPRVQVADNSGAIPASVPAPAAPPNQPGVLYQGRGKGVRSATPEELGQYGLPANASAQVDLATGRLHVVNKGSKGEGGPFGGPAATQQNRNLWIKLQTKVANGETLTPQEQLSMELLQQDAQQPRTMVTDQGLVQVPGAPLPTMGGQRPAQQPAPATDTVPNPLQPASAAPAVPPVQAPPDQPAVRIIQPKAEKASNEQNLNAGFANRLNASNNELDELDTKGYDAPSLKDRLLDKVPGVNGYLTSDKFQQLEQAQRDFVTAQLRRESGAAISHSEIEEAKKLYFPQPGEGSDIVARKRATREMAIRNMAQSAGPAALEFKPKPAPKEGDKPATATTIIKFDAEGNIIQ